MTLHSAELDSINNCKSNQSKEIWKKTISPKRIILKKSQKTKEGNFDAINTKNSNKSVISMQSIGKIPIKRQFF